MATPAQYAQNSSATGIDRAHRTVIFASSLGTVCSFTAIVGMLPKYGPIAAWLVEMFPTRIRYSSWYPVIVASLTAVIGLLFLRETKGTSLT